MTTTAIITFTCALITTAAVLLATIAYMRMIDALNTLQKQRDFITKAYLQTLRAKAIELEMYEQVVAIDSMLEEFDNNNVEYSLNIKPKN